MSNIEEYRIEISKLATYLFENGYKFNYHPLFDGYQIIVYNEDNAKEWDVVCHGFSYGHECNLLEGMGTIFGEDVEGYLTAENVIDILEGRKCIADI